MTRFREKKNGIFLTEQLSDKFVKISTFAGIGSYLATLQPIADLG